VLVKIEEVFLQFLQHVNTIKPIGIGAFLFRFVTGKYFPHELVQFFYGRWYTLLYVLGMSSEHLTRRSPDPRENLFRKRPIRTVNNVANHMAIPGVPPNTNNVLFLHA
jgi:hypothetical protein